MLKVAAEGREPTVRRQDHLRAGGPPARDGRAVSLPIHRLALQGAPPAGRPCQRRGRGSRVKPVDNDDLQLVIAAQPRRDHGPNASDPVATALYRTTLGAPVTQ